MNRAVNVFKHCICGSFWGLDWFEDQRELLMQVLSVNS